MKRIYKIATVLITMAILSINASAYDVTNAIAYAKANVYNQSSGLCAQYCSEAINAGGIDCYSVSCSTLVNQLKKSGEGYFITLTKNSNNSVSYSANKNKIAKGDLVFWRCGCDSNKPYVHVAIYSGYNSNKNALKFYARNKSKNNEILYYSCGYCGNKNTKPIAFHFTNTTAKVSISAPANVKIKAAKVGATSTINWGSVNGADHYDVEIYRGDGSLLKKYYNLRKTSVGHRFTETGKYSVYVAAVSDENSSSWKFAPKVEVNITGALSVSTLTLTDLPKGTVSCYTIPNTTTRDLYANAALTKPLNGEVWNTDELRLTEVTNTYIKFQYPIANGKYRTAYAKPSLVFNGTTVKQVSAKYNAIVYTRSTGSKKLGTMFSTDTIYMIGNPKDGRTQVLYNISDGYKLGWCDSTAIK